MAKNYAAIYNSANDSIALEQRFYLKEEVSRGVMVFPLGTDHFLHLPGGQITFEQPWESSMQRSGRHHNNIIVKKKVSSFSFTTYFNMDENAANGATAVDEPIKVLFKSLLGYENNVGGTLVYDTSVDPNVTFTLMEVGDKWARQSPGCFISGGNIQLPGDGEATIEWSGNGKTTYTAGIASSTVDNNTGNVIQLEAGEAKRFRVGAAVMLILDDGILRSVDTPDGSPRLITNVDTGLDQITINGAVLGDFDGSVNPVYVCYYEPENPTAVDNPITGLVGSVTIASISTPQCVRSLGLNVQNNHELVDYCYGEDGLGGSLFVPGDRVTCEVSLSMNMNHSVLGFFNGLLEFETEDIDATLGDVAGRHYSFSVPAARFQVPGFAVPDTGSIPVEFSGMAFQTALDAADEIVVQIN